MVSARKRSIPAFRWVKSIFDVLFKLVSQNCLFSIKFQFLQIPFITFEKKKNGIRSGQS
jgi:hypothetical protein